MANWLLKHCGDFFIYDDNLVMKPYLCIQICVATELISRKNKNNWKNNLKKTECSHSIMVTGVENHWQLLRHFQIYKSAIYEKWKENLHLNRSFYLFINLCVFSPLRNFRFLMCLLSILLLLSFSQIEYFLNVVCILRLLLIW